MYLGRSNDIVLASVILSASAVYAIPCCFAFFGPGAKNFVRFGSGKVFCI